jgi:omega-hydroxy-beta-dihydromenaquinone-9 sulfotransferase
VYQAVFPGSFLTTRGVVGRMTSGLLPETRGYDNVKQGWDEAAEDEIALAKTTGLSPYLGFMFPEHAARYERYVDFLEATAEERDHWKAGLRYFLKKVMLASGGRQVVLKSCAHTARIRILREMFPTARFVYIHRHPYRVFSSTLHMRSHTDWENFFQVPWENWEEERERQTLVLGRRIFERYLEDRALLGDHLVEIAYDDFVGREVEVLRDAFSRLGLEGWERGEPALREYLAGLDGYRTNTLRITDRQKARVHEAWRLAFDAHGYSPETDA